MMLIVLTKSWKERTARNPQIAVLHWRKNLDVTKENV